MTAGYTPVIVIIILLLGVTRGKGGVGSVRSAERSPGVFLSTAPEKILLIKS